LKVSQAMRFSLFYRK